MHIGFNTSVFNSVLPSTSGPIEREETDQQQAEALAKTGKTASAGAIWMSTDGDVLNSWTVLEARKIQRANWQKALDEREERNRNATEKLEEDATAIYKKFCERARVD